MTITDIIGLIGYMGLTGALIMCVCLILLSLLLHFRPLPGLEKLADWLAHTQTGLMGLAVLSLGLLLQMGAYEYEVVFNAVESAMPPIERMGGLWSGQASSLLFFAFILSIAVSLSISIARRMDSPVYIKTILLILETTLLFFLVPDVFINNPFVKIWMLPNGAISTAIFPPDASSALLISTDGQGMNPSLRHLAMLLHPPTLYLGLIGFFIPYAFMLAALLNGDDATAWVQPLYPLVLAAWIFLTIGMFLGSWWAYTILGWGGYWGWDAVEISGLVPWLLSFGLLHSMRMQLRGLRYQGWIKGFTAAFVLLTLFGILITRSGILESVHAYSSGAMGPMLTVLIVLHLIAVIGLLILRRGANSKNEPVIPRSYSDRFTRLFNLCLVGLVIICVFGQTLPLTSQVFSGQSVSFSAQNYERICSPFFLLLLILTAFCPVGDQIDRDPQAARRILIQLALLSALVPLIVLFFYSLSLSAISGFWTAAFLLLSWLRMLWRDGLRPQFRRKGAMQSRRLGVILIHLGLAFLALGILGVETLSQTYEGQLSAGETINTGEHTISAGQALNYLSESGNVIFELPVSITSPSTERQVIPAIIHYTKLGTLYAQPGLANGWLQDVQIILEDMPASANQPYSMRIAYFPLISWIWIGGLLMAIGGFLGLLRPKNHH